MLSQDVKQLRELPMRFSTNAWVLALTSFFVVASITETLTKHPLLRATVVSTGKCVVPHVCTSVVLESEINLVKTNLKSDAPEQPDVEGKFTFSVMLGGRIGLDAGETRASVRVVVSWA